MYIQTYKHAYIRTYACLSLCLPLFVFALSQCYIIIYIIHICIISYNHIRKGHNSPEDSAPKISTEKLLAGKPVVQASSSPQSKPPAPRKKRTTTRLYPVLFVKSLIASYHHINILLHRRIIVSHHITSHHTITCHVIEYRIIYHHIMSHHNVPHHTMTSHIIPCHNTSSVMYHV